MPNAYSIDEFIQAVINKDKKVVTHCLKQGLDPLAINSNEDSEFHGATAFHFAAAYNRLDLLNLMLNKVETIDKQDSFGNTAVHAAIHSNQLEAVQALIAKNASCLIKNSDNYNALQFAIVEHKNEIAEWLITNDHYDISSIVKPDAKAKHIQRLFLYGANPNLAYTANNENYTATSLLQENCPDRDTDMLVGHAACQLKAFIYDLEADQLTPEQTEQLKQTLAKLKLTNPINDLTAIFKLLHDYHTWKGTAKLDIRLRNLQKRVYQHLYEQHQDVDNSTTLYFAVACEKLDAVKTLIAKDADCLAVDARGREALQFALAGHKKEIAEWLITNHYYDIPSIIKPEAEAKDIQQLFLYGADPKLAFTANNKKYTAASLLKECCPDRDTDMLVGHAACQLKDFVNDFDADNLIFYKAEWLQQSLAKLKLPNPINDLAAIFKLLHDYHTWEGTANRDVKLQNLQKHVYRHLYKQQQSGWRWRITFTIIAFFLLTPLSLCLTIPLMLMPYRRQMLRKKIALEADTNKDAIARTKAQLNGSSGSVSVRAKVKPTEFLKPDNLLRKASYDGYKIMTPKQAAKYKHVKQAYACAVNGIIQKREKREQLSAEYLQLKR